MQKWKIMLDFRLFAVKSMTFSLAPLFKNPGIYWKGILETFTRWPNSAPELLLLLLAVIFRYSTVIYTWIFENRVNESFIFFEVVLILRLSLKDTVSKLRSKEVFLFMSAVFLHLVQQLVAWKREAKKKKKTNAKERKRLKKLDGFWPKNYLEILISAHAWDLLA